MKSYVFGTVCIFHYFREKYINLFGNLAAIYFRILSWISKGICTLPIGIVLRYVFRSNFVYCCFLCFSSFWFYSESCIAKEAFLKNLLFCSKSFCDHFGVCLSILESYFICFLVKFCTDVFLHYAESHCIVQYVPLCWVYYLVCGSIFGIFLNVLRNLRHSLDFLHKCLGITVVATKLKTDACHYWADFGVFNPFATILLKQ